MEKQLFDWENWDTVDTMVFQFYNCVLKKDIGSHKVNDPIDYIVVNYEDGYLEIKDVKYPLTLNVSENLSEQSNT